MLKSYTIVMNFPISPFSFFFPFPFGRFTLDNYLLGVFLDS